MSDRSMDHRWSSVTMGDHGWPRHRWLQPQQPKGLLSLQFALPKGLQGMRSAKLTENCLFFVIERWKLWKEIRKIIEIDGPSDGLNMSKPE